MPRTFVDEAGITRALGWIKQHHDASDWKYSVAFPDELTVSLPRKASNRQWRSHIEDQGNLGSCVAHAVTSMTEAHFNKAGLPFVDLSRLFVYFGARDLEGTSQIDAGCYGRDACKFVNTVGLCNEALWTYDDGPKKFKKKPDKKAYQNAALRKGFPYYRILGLQQMKANIAAGYGAVAGVTVYENVMTNEVMRTGLWPLPKGRPIGGHYLFFDSFDDDAKCADGIVGGFDGTVNSWGVDVGRKGEFTIPYQFFLDPNLSSDFQTAR